MRTPRGDETKFAPLREYPPSLPSPAIAIAIASVAGDESVGQSLRPTIGSRLSFLRSGGSRVVGGVRRGFLHDLSCRKFVGMIIEDLEEVSGPGCRRSSRCGSHGQPWGLSVDAKRAAVGVGARILFYPSVACNVFRNLFEHDFHWWDRVDENVLLGAVPFPGDVPRLKDFGVSAVITLTEPYETLVPASLYHAYGIENLVLPTRDYLYAPTYDNLCEGVDFIHKNASCGKVTYVHCKAGRGRSTTVVLCYLVQHNQMTPSEAYEYVKLRRPRILLASAQWQAVQEFYQLRVKQTIVPRSMNDKLDIKQPLLVAKHNVIAFDDSMVVVISESDIQGYDPDALAGSDDHAVWKLSIIYHVQLAKKAALASLSYVLFKQRKAATFQLSNSREEHCSAEAEEEHLGKGSPSIFQGVVVN